MYNHSLKNKVVIVTGGSGGIGNAIVNKLSDCGANVISVYCRNLPTDHPNENLIPGFKLILRIRKNGKSCYHFLYKNSERLMCL